MEDMGEKKKKIDGHRANQHWKIDYWMDNVNKNESSVNKSVFKMVMFLLTT